LNNIDYEDSSTAAFHEQRQRQGPIWILADAPEITFRRWCCNNGASGRDRRDFRVCLRFAGSSR